MLPDGTERKIFASEFGDDYNAIPCYEQIYALAGLTQVYRITGDPKLREVIDLTINLFDKYFKDTTSFSDGTPRRGYYSHIDPVTFDPLSPALDDGTRSNRDRKNWNSVGDHIPAYLINLFLATGEERFADMLEDQCDTITEALPGLRQQPLRPGEVLRRLEQGPEVRPAAEPRHRRAQPEDRLEPDAGQQRPAQGRVRRVRREDRRADAGRRHATASAAAGTTWSSGSPRPGETFHRLVWHDRKAWWQQEQGILAYLILNGVFGKPEYAKQARESAAFYNAWMLDTGAGGVYFNVLANGMPFALGGERSKGSHSMAMYHSAELAFLAAVYGNLLSLNQPMDLFFHPQPGAFGGVLRVSPDLLPPKSVKIVQVWVNGHEHRDFDPVGLTVRLPRSHDPQTVRVRLAPVAVYVQRRHARHHRRHRADRVVRHARRRRPGRAARAGRGGADRRLRHDHHRRDRPGVPRLRRRCAISH